MVEKIHKEYIRIVITVITVILTPHIHDLFNSVVQVFINVRTEVKTPPTPCLQIYRFTPERLINDAMTVMTVLFRTFYIFIET